MRVSSCNGSVLYKKNKNAEKHFRDTPPTAVAAVHHGSLTQEQEGRSAPGNPIMHLS